MDDDAHFEITRLLCGGRICPLQKVHWTVFFTKCSENPLNIFYPIDIYDTRTSCAYKNGWLKSSDIIKWVRTTDPCYTQSAIVVTQNRKWAYGAIKEFRTNKSAILIDHYLTIYNERSTLNSSTSSAVPGSNNLSSMVYFPNSWFSNEPQS